MNKTQEPTCRNSIITKKKKKLKFECNNPKYKNSQEKAKRILLNWE
jgi:hypothetical protein